MKMMLLKLVSVLLVAGCITLVVLYVKGRDSNYFKWISAAVSPITHCFYSAEKYVLSLPFFTTGGKGDFSQWRFYKAHLADVSFDDGAISLRPSKESVWWRNERGPYLFHYIKGDVSASATIRVRKNSDRKLPPDKEWQFGGIMLRDPRGDLPLSSENYVFNVVGHRGKSLQVETKSTRKGESHVDAWDWNSGDADIRIERRGAAFTMYARRDSHEEWKVLTRYERGDLPEVLQIGIIVYAYSEGRGELDMVAAFDDIKIE